MQNIFLSVFPIFIIIFMGRIIKDRWIASEEFWKELENLSYFLLFPVVMFNYITQTTFESGELTKLVLLLMFLTILLSAFVVYLQEAYFKESFKLFTSIFQGSVRYNNYLFIGIGGALYGDAGLEIVSVVAAYMIIITNALTILIFNSYVEKDTHESKIYAILNIIKKCLSNPMILSSILAFTFNYTAVDMNFTIRKTLTIISDSALFFALICLGSQINFKIENGDLRPILRTCIIKLLIMPFIAFLIFTMFNISGLTRSVGILYASLPCATTSFLFSKQLGGDAKAMTSIITLSIIFGIFTIPLMIYLFSG